jgi:hypothetical protein
MPFKNGRDARSRSRVRQPSMVVSSVTTIPEQPQALARCKKLTTSSSERLQYSWKKRDASSIAAAQVSMGTEA